MKNILLSIVIVFALGCDKDDENNDQSFLLSQTISFKIGEDISNNELKISGFLEMVDGELVHNYIEGLPWNEMGLLEISAMTDFPLFGTICNLNNNTAYCPFPYSRSDDFDYSTDFISDKYLYLQYQSQSFDTLKIRETYSVDLGSGSVQFFLNGFEKERLEYTDSTNGNFAYKYITLENLIH